MALAYFCQPVCHSLRFLHCSTRHIDLYKPSCLPAIRLEWVVAQVETPSTCLLSVLCWPTLSHSRIFLDALPYIRCSYVVIYVAFSVHWTWISARDFSMVSFQFQSTITTEVKKKRQFKHIDFSALCYEFHEIIV